MGLSDEEFGDLTYAMFDALLSRKREEEKKEWSRTATLAAAIINYSMCHPEQPVKIKDLMPRFEDDEKPKDLSTMPAQEAASYVMSMFAKRTITQR